VVKVIDIAKGRRGDIGLLTEEIRWKLELALSLTHSLEANEAQ
jgi:hypothetical protein